MNTHQNGTSHAGAAAPQRQKVQFLLNVPAYLRLEFDPPSTPRAGRFGDQYMYWAEDQVNEGMPVTLFADPPLHELIAASGARAGDVVAICKHEIRQGMQKRIQWEVTSQAAAPVHAPAAPVNRQQNHAPAPRSQAAPAIPVRASAAPSAQTHSGNQMADALTLAIEACQFAGFEARTEDIRALAITIYIQTTGGKR